MRLIALRVATREVYLYRLEVKRFRKAQRSFVGGRDENLAAERQEAIQRRDCEDCLRLGIEAFRWLQKGRQDYQQDVYDGQSMYDDDTERQLTDLYQRWLIPRAAAKRWIVDLQARGFPPGNTGEFRQCCIEAAAILEERRMVEVARRARSQSAGDDG